jgi:hypothetical protein
MGLDRYIWGLVDSLKAEDGRRHFILRLNGPQWPVYNDESGLSGHKRDELCLS